MLLQFVALQSLRVFDLLLRVFVCLQNLVVFLLSLFEVLVHLVLELLAKSTHLVLLLLHQFGFGCQDLLISDFHVILTLLFLQLIGTLLHLMSLLIVFLLSQVLLDLAHV